MENVDEKFRLSFEVDANKKILVDKVLLGKLKRYNYSEFPEGTIVQRKYPSVYDIFPKIGGHHLAILFFPIECKIKIANSYKVIFLYSYKHLKLILADLKEYYKNPYFYSTYHYNDFYVNVTDIKERFFSYEKRPIEIKEKNEKANEEEIKKIYKDIKNIYSNYSDKITYEYISPNFNTYFPKINPGKPSDYFDFCYTNKRKDLESSFSRFLEDKVEMIYPVCGPHNIGKTISSLIIQKISLIDGVKSLYLNIKYYFDKPFDDFKGKINTLIKECVLLVDSEEELLTLYKKFIKTVYINGIIEILKEFLVSKNFDKNHFFLIFDQFQIKYDLNLLNTFSGFKIFLLSSINDYDVKNNLIYSYAKNSKTKYRLAEDNKPSKIINYHYYEELLDFKDFFKLFEKQIKDKIKSENKYFDDNTIIIKFNFIDSILKKFNYIPKYCLRYIYHYDTIYDLMFNEYKNIFLKLLQFEKNKTIDIKKIAQLSKNEYLIEQKKEDEKFSYKTLQADDYIEYLKYIPLKYINYHITDKNELYFYCSFPLFKDIIMNFIDYFDSKEKFLITAEGIERDTVFEKILKYQFTVFKKLNINAHLEVNTIIDMNLTENYSSFEQKYLEGKKNILITQKNKGGQDYDFAIYMAENCQLMLIQSKYQIEHKLIKNRKEYEETSKLSLENFNKAFKKKIEKVYLIYISSEEYNKKRKAKVKGLLDKNKINCLFYSVSYDTFSFDFENKIENLECDESFMILPEFKNYKSQEFKIEPRVKQKAQINTRNNRYLFLGKKVKKSYDINKIYKSLKNYCSENLEISLDKFDEFGCYDDYCNFKKEVNIKYYIALFYLKENDDSSIDFSKPIGLNYVEKEKEINLYIIAKTNYSTFEELIEKFSNKFYFGIGNLLSK